MKKWIVIILAMSLALALCGCDGRGPAEPDTPTQPDISDTPDTPDAPEDMIYAPVFTRSTLPRFDGSTSTAPLAEAVCSALLGESRESVQDLIHFSKTTNAYFNLLHGEADILIVGEANDDVFAEKEALGFQWEQTPFATDAFVFVVNEDNPVDSITVDEARRIYAGEITNWKELGGEDREIIPFQRNRGAGSQTLMEKLVMQGTPMMEAPTDWVVTTMGELMEAVKGYDNSPGAIGYSVYYYAREMRMAEGLKLLRLEDVEPNPQTIRGGTYPLVNPKYVVIAANLPEDDPAKVIYDWLLSDDGQKLIAREGYVSILDVSTGEYEAEPLVGSRWYEDYQGELQPGSYGALIPYAGRRLMDDWPARSGCLYGLMTPEGKVVVDPVYSAVRAAGDILILQRGTQEGMRAAVAARSGNWCTDFEYNAVALSGEGAVLFRENNLTLVRTTGEAVSTLTPADMGITKEQFDNMRYAALSGEGMGGEWAGDRLSISYDYENEGAEVLCYNIASGKTGRISFDEWYSDPGFSYEEETPPAIEGAEYIYDSVLGTDAPKLLAVYDYGETERRSYYYEDGTPIPSLTITGSYWYEDVSLVGGLIERLELDTATYYDMNTMNVVFRTRLGYGGD